MDRMTAAMKLDSKDTAEHDASICSPTLLSLPGEIRKEIYSHVVTTLTCMNLRTLRPQSLALANRQLFGEVMPAFFEHNTFTLDVYFDPLYDPTQNLITAAHPKDAPELAARMTAFVERKPFSQERQETEKERWQHFVFARNRYLNSSKACRDRFAFNPEPTFRGPQLWMRLLHPGLLIKDIEFQVYLPDEGQDYTRELAVTAKLRVNPQTQTMSKWVFRVGHRWPNCPYLGDADEVTEAKHRQAMNDALGQVKTDIWRIAKAIENKGKPLGMTMKDIEAVVIAFDTHGWWVDGLEPHRG